MVQKMNPNNKSSFRISQVFIGSRYFVTRKAAGRNGSDEIKQNLLGFFRGKNFLGAKRAVENNESRIDLTRPKVAI